MTYVIPLGQLFLTSKKIKNSLFHEGYTDPKINGTRKPLGRTKTLNNVQTTGIPCKFKANPYLIQNPASY